MKKIMLIAALVIAAVSFEGCTRRVYVGPPPPPRVEIIPVAPSPRHVWVQGYYANHHRQYVWRPGHYVVRRGYRR